MATMNRDIPYISFGLRLLGGVLVGAAVAICVPAALGQGNSPESKPQERDPFAPAPPKARALPSILEYDAQGLVVWIRGDPSRKVMEVMDLSDEDRQILERIMAERDDQLLQAAVPVTDKIMQAHNAWRDGEGVAFDPFGRFVMNSLGAFGRRGAFYIDSAVRKTISRTAYTDLNAIMREYNRALVVEVRDDLLAAAEGTDTPEVLLRESTILQRFQQRDVVFDAARLLKERFGGDDALAEAHPELAQTIENEGYWEAMSRLTNAQLEAFVREHTGMEVQFPSPAVPVDPAGSTGPDDSGGA